MSMVIGEGASDKLVSYIEVRLDGMHCFSIDRPSAIATSNYDTKHPRTTHVCRLSGSDERARQESVSVLV